MSKRISLLVTAALMAAMMMVATAAPAFAASGSERECEAKGGTYTKNGSESKCVLPEVIVQGKNEKQPKFQQQTQTTETGQGNLSNKEDDTTTTTCNTPCPPGQFR